MLRMQHQTNRQPAAHITGGRMSTSELPIPNPNETRPPEPIEHTPGPWRVSNAHGLCVAAAGVGVIADLDDELIAQPQHAEANARLIAAAPELLACLKEALELIQEDVDNRDG